MTRVHVSMCDCL